MGLFVFGVPFQEISDSFLALRYFQLLRLGLGLLVPRSPRPKSRPNRSSWRHVVAIVLGGFMFPRTTMPEALKLIGNLFPLTHFIPIARGTSLKGSASTC
jgi:ABC-2 type transport system permease protein